jgi:hypothetical protein
MRPPSCAIVRDSDGQRDNRQDLPSKRPVGDCTYHEKREGHACGGLKLKRDAHPSPLLVQSYMPSAQHSRAEGSASPTPHHRHVAATPSTDQAEFHICAWVNREPSTHHLPLGKVHMYNLDQSLLPRRTVRDPFHPRSFRPTPCRGSRKVSGVPRIFWPWLAPPSYCTDSSSSSSESIMIASEAVAP